MSRIKRWIIGGLLGLLLPWLSGCSALGLAYNNGAQLSWWWLDGYVDFSREQAPRVRQHIDRLFDWHRASQLPDTAALLASAQSQVTEPTTAALACRWQEQVRALLEPTIVEALGHAADIVPILGEAQIDSIDKRYAKGNAEMREEFLQPDPTERRVISVKRALDRAERLYGSLDEAQKQIVAAGVAASPFDPDLWLAERQRRQRDTLATLRKLLADRADRDQRLLALRLLVTRVERSPNPEYRAYQIRLKDYNCALAAQIHNATTTGQRRKARANLKGWEADLRAVMLRE